MATTTNYGWTTPDDTALVKDGASAIRTLGSSVDTTTKALNPETTLGDLAYRSSTANVKTRLGLGTAGQVLQVNSGATAPEWATPASGSMTLLSTTTLSGTSTTISGISSSYNILRIYITNAISGSATYMSYQLNGITANDYYESSVETNWTAASQALRRNTGDQFYLTPNTTISTSANQNFGYIEIPNYASTTARKCIDDFFSYVNSSSQIVSHRGFHYYNTSASAISSIKFLSSAGSFNSGTVLIYGVK
jgi:hypothetical protein